MRFLIFEEQIRSDHAVRFIDAFVDKLDLFKFEFTTQTIKRGQATQNAGIKILVAMAELVNSSDHGTQAEYMVSKFTCPQGHLAPQETRPQFQR